MCKADMLKVITNKKVIKKGKKNPIIFKQTNKQFNLNDSFAQLFFSLDL